MRALRHNTSNPITLGIWRIPWGTGTAIRKVIGHGEAVHPDWTVSDVPDRLDYWEREALAYENELPRRFGPDLRAPLLLARRDLEGGAVELVLEDVAGRTAGALEPGDYEDIAQRLGAAQGRQALDRSWEALPWLSRGFLRGYVASKHVRDELVDDERAWASALCRSWPDGAREAARRLRDEREVLLTLAEAAPRTLGHLDLWANNVLVPAAGPPVLLDWACAGDAALGEDLSNLLAEAVLDLYVPAASLPELDRALFAAYLRGLRQAGWDGPQADVRRGVCASVVKWSWLAPLHLERALTGGHHLYGGETDPTPERQYRERGAALAFFGRLAAEALEGC